MCLNLHVALATEYYLSNKNGNDLNNGSSPRDAWQSLNKLNSMMESFKPGDNILFEKGSTFTGQINLKISGNENFPISFGSYGEGENPVISGSIQIKQWRLYKNKIYVADASVPIYNLFINSRQMILARYPNSGYLKIGSQFSNPNSGFKDPALKQPDAYWNGCNVRIRTVNWAFEYTKVKDFSSSNIKFDKPTLYPALSGWGYYLDNKLEELDVENEWYYDEIQKKVYLFAPEGADPNNLMIEGSVYDFGMFSNNILSNVIIRDLDIRNQVQSGLSFYEKKSNIQINNCIFSNQLQGGVRLFNVSYNCSIDNCRFYSINGKAIDMMTSKNIRISNNIIKNIGMIPGYGITEDAFSMSGLVILPGDSLHIFNNYIDSIGHDGINCIGSGNVIEKNVINNCFLLLIDGGAIKCF